MPSQPTRRTPSRSLFGLLGHICAAPVALMLALVLVVGHVQAPAARADSPRPFGLSATGIVSLDAVDTVRFDYLETDALLRDDEQGPQVGVPLRFAVPRPVDFGFETAGTWEALPGGAWLWRMQIASPGATSLAVNLDEFYLPSGSQLHFYAADGSHVHPAFTAADNKHHRRLDSPPILTDEMVIELFLPSQEARDRAELHVKTVAQGYRDVFGPSGKALEKSGACNIDVACPEGNAWRDEIRAIARLVINNFSLCTGFLVENTSRDDRPLLATAHHCGVNDSAAQTLQVSWNYESSTCRPPGSSASGGPGNGDSGIDQRGSKLLFSDSVSDTTIVELDDSPAPHNPYLLGWDARDITPARTVAIHHPQGEEKRISFENDAVTVTSFGADGSPGDGTHLKVADWDEGTTEGGSSGSPLIDRSTRRVVGELHGGLAACGNNDPDWYGRIRTAYLRGADVVLDPAGSGALFADGRDFGIGTDPDPGPDPEPEPDPDDPPDVEPFDCIEGPAVLCLNDDRFQVEVEFRDFKGNVGVGTVVDLGKRAPDASGLFWFFGDNNWEVLVKVLDGCDINGHFWVFAAGATTVEYQLEVTDSLTGDVQVFVNPLGQGPEPITDVGAFPCD